MSSFRIYTGWKRSEENIGIDEANFKISKSYRMGEVDGRSERKDRRLIPLNAHHVDRHGAEYLAALTNDDLRTDQVCAEAAERLPGATTLEKRRDGF